MDPIEKDKSNINRHPWEIARSESILKIIKTKYSDKWLADIGAGDLFFTKKLFNFTSNPVYAVDPVFYKINDKHQKIIFLDEVSNLPKNKIDSVFLMDVLEHIKEDEIFLSNVIESLKEGGKIIITVPAFQRLFSQHDVFLKHYRRYNYKRLNKLLIHNNIKVKEIFYFYTPLFVLRLLQVIYSKFNFSSNKNKGKKNKGIGKWKLTKNNIITKFIVLMLKIDFILNRKLKKIGIKLPGLSLCAICQKKSA